MPFIFSDAIAGATSGFIIGVLLQPLEIIKVCLIVNPMQLAIIEKTNFATSFATSVKVIYKTEGLKGFWRGLSPALLRIVAGSGVYFQILNQVNQRLKSFGLKESRSDFLASGFARSISSFVCNPLTVIRTRFEMVGFHEYNNIWDAMKKIQKTEGIRGFLKGSLACILRDGPFAGLYFAILNQTKKELRPLNMTPSTTTMISGIFAGAIATTITHPFEVLRTKLQVDLSRNGNNIQGYKHGICHGLYYIWENEGLFGLMKGLAPRLLRKPLANALTFTIYELFKGNNSYGKDRRH